MPGIVQLICAKRPRAISAAGKFHRIAAAEAPRHRSGSRWRRISKTARCRRSREEEARSARRSTDLHRRQRHAPSKILSARFPECAGRVSSPHLRRYGSRSLCRRAVQDQASKPRAVARFRDGIDELHRAFVFLRFLKCFLDLSEFSEQNRPGHPELLGHTRIVRLRCGHIKKASASFQLRYGGLVLRHFFWCWRIGCVWIVGHELLLLMWTRRKRPCSPGESEVR